MKITLQLGVCVALMLLSVTANARDEINPRVMRFIGHSSVVLLVNGNMATVRIGEHLGNGR
jgi:hypothetical protein